MNLVTRIKNILVSPKTEWEVIATETTQPMELFSKYLLILALIPAIATFIGYGIIGQNIMGIHIGSVNIGIRQAVVSLIATLIGAFVTAFVVDALATSFGARKNFNQAFKLVVYSYTPMMVTGFFNIIPSLGIISALAGIYGLYIFYLGIQPLMKAPEEKKTTYFVVSILVIIGVYFILSAIIAAVLLPSRAMLMGL